MALRTRIKLCSLCVSVIIIACVASANAAPDVRALVRRATSDFKDITLTCKVKYANQSELKKISSDFGKSYEIKSTTVKFKSPDKMKMEGKLGLLRAAIVINGDRKATMIPTIRYSKKEDISDKPHKRQSDLDVGVVTESLWRDYHVLSVMEEKGAKGPVYRMTFTRDKSDGKKRVCWIDAKTFKLLKLDKYQENGSLKARYLYSNHSLVGGIVWVPGRVDVYSPDGKLAGTTVYENIKVNTGIPDSEFKF